jgi:CubicO group peptidase (beta-lactamase class C family)
MTIKRLSTSIFPWKTFFWKALYRFILLGLALLLLSLLAVNIRWSLLAGPAAGQVAFFRLLSHGPTKIDDFEKYPARRLAASPAASPLPEPAATSFSPGPALAKASLQADLPGLLSSSDTIAFLILRGDALIEEQYFQGHSAASLSQLFSVTKSINSSLVGLAIDEGIFHSVDQTVTDFVPELSDRGFDRVTMAHLLSMISGTDYVESDNPFGVHVPFNYTSDLEKMIRDFRMVAEPGRTFRYKSGDTALLGLALSRALAPRSISQYAQEKLWLPLGMEYDGVWTVDREGGLEKNWCCLAMTARDLVRFGRLYLHQGMWAGRQLLDSAWVEASTGTGSIPAQKWPQGFADIGMRNYGYSWWLLSPQEGDYLALGKDGQFLYINPTRDVVIVRLGWSMGSLSTARWIELFQVLAREGS